MKAGTKASAKKITKAEERHQAAQAAKAAGQQATPVNVYIPKTGNTVSALSSTNAKTGKSFTAQPKMYGGAATAADATNYDWAKNGLEGLKPPP